jgi:hypothetical protein
MSEAYAVEVGTDVLTVRMENVKPGWEQWFLITSDEHWDNPHCDRVTLRKHHDQAKERGAGIFKVGDFFCAMQGKYDPRSDKASVRPEHREGNYLDSIVDTAAAWCEGDPIEMLSMGNHEASIASRLETNLINRLAAALGKKDRAFGYSGFVRFMFLASGGGRSSKVLYWHHGAGGGGVVTKGVMRANRQSAYVADADIIVGGHYHESWMVVTPRVHLGNNGKWHIEDQYHLCTGTYKQEFDLHGGFHVERGRPPKPLGGWWMRFYFDKTQRGHIGVEFTLAK